MVEAGGVHVDGLGGVGCVWLQWGGLKLMLGYKVV